jgi:Zn-dependent protease with chaperone function
VYIAPIFAGAVLLFFLIKPLFARRSRSRPLRTLEFGEEPVLAALVTRVAQAFGAPEPRQIALDCQANASASFGSAFGGFFGSDLVLTLGLPLVAGLTIQQLTGVIAHELGHFGQGTGMRLTYLIRSVNNWFARVVYERDDWDEHLARGCEEGDRLAPLFWLAALCVWLTRRVLWLLMAVSHGMSCFLLRQMEFDADHQETQLVGSGGFAESSRQILLLDIASDAAYRMANGSWRTTSRVPEDLSALVVYVAAQVPQDVLRTIESEVKKSKTGLFDTHPSHGDRLASARRDKAPGIFHMEGPATALFKDFGRTSKTVTFDFYRQVLGKRVKRDALVPIATIIGAKDSSMRPG